MPAWRYDSKRDSLWLALLVHVVHIDHFFFRAGPIVCIQLCVLHQLSQLRRGYGEIRRNFKAST